MYQTDYFIRFVNSKKEAKRNMEDCVSYSMYLEFGTKKEALSFKEDYEQLSAPVKCSDKKWRFPLDGLCGFGPYETIDECEEILKTKHGYNGCSYPFAMICEGKYRGEADGGDGDMFEPVKLIKVIKLEN